MHTYRDLVESFIERRGDRAAFSNENFSKMRHECALQGAMKEANA